MKQSKKHLIKHEIIKDFPYLTFYGITETAEETCNNFFVHKIVILTPPGKPVSTELNEKQKLNLENTDPILTCKSLEEAVEAMAALIK